MIIAYCINNGRIADSYDTPGGIQTGHFRVAVNLILKARLSAKFLLRK